jgi:hypothetical protein
LSLSSILCSSAIGFLLYFLFFNHLPEIAKASESKEDAAEADRSF